MPNCISPVQVKQKDQSPVYVKCGKCYICQSKRTSGWGFRLSKQSELYLHSLFVTLTYNNETIPISKNGYRTLKKDDLTNFFKRLRKSPTGLQKITYYACGEYGTLKKRPHYHIILFGCTYSQIQRAWSTYDRNTKQFKPIGEIYFGNVQGASCSYVLKYLTKPPTVGLHSRDDRQHEYSVMSKGLGENYLTPEMIRYHHADLENRLCIHTEGKKISMPEYYKKRIYNSEQKGHLKGYFEWLTPLIEGEEREKHLHLTDSEYSKMKIEQHKNLTTQFRLNSLKNRS